MPSLSYRASLKNLDVEEVVDLAVHRPLGYLVARIAYPTPITPDAITILSMIVGVAAGVLYAAPMVTGHGHQVLAALLFIASAVLDCSDGQLARMRQRSSRYGRMLDGAVDAVVQVAVIPAAAAQMVWRLGGLTEPIALAWAALAILAVLSGVRHTTLYDQFKNVYARNTEPTPRDCDDADDLEAEWQRVRAAGPVAIGTRFRFEMYKLHLGLVAQTMRWLDPYVPTRFADMPSYSPERAERFRFLHRRLMRAWSFYGIGTHIFLVAIATMFDRLEWYIVVRLVGFNAALLWLVPQQRRASRAFFGAPDNGPAQQALAA